MDKIIPDVMQVVAIAEQSGKTVMEIYFRNNFSLTYKGDDSPVTCADLASHQFIYEHLKIFTPELPIISEECKAIPYKDRNSYDEYWLVDPLDGTKEFIKRNGEFTVNIALIKKRNSVLGVVHAPALGITYFAARGRGSFKKENNGHIKKIRVSDPRKYNVRIVSSRSHKNERLQIFIRKLTSKIDNIEYITMGSSLKLCLIAEGTCHIYPRLGPTMEWDTAAAQCIVEEAGGIVVDMAGKPLRYNKENLVNNDFIVSCSNKLFQYFME